MQGVMTRQLAIDSHYDLTIIGAGVFGTALALEAAHRGLSTLLVDRADFAGATSANSLKTIHGGLRYLQQLDITSCRQSSLERKAWLHMSPDLVRPLDCLLPTHGLLMKGPLAIAAGLSLYNLITLDRNKVVANRARVSPGWLRSKRQAASFLGDVKLDYANGAAYWQDAQVQHSERLVYLMAAKAQSFGADCHNYIQVDDVKPLDEGFQIRCIDTLTQQQYETTSSRVVDCSGAANTLGKLLKLEEDPPPYVCAVNLIVNRRLVDMAAGLTDDSSRALFLSPWRGSTLVGTWYFKESQPSKAQLEACLDQINALLSNTSLQWTDVSRVHIGHLPADQAALEHSGAEQALVKHTQCVDWSKYHSAYSGLYTLRGTKYTLARHSAQQLVDQWSEPGITQSASLRMPLYPEHEVNDDESLDITTEQLQFIETYFKGAWPEIMRYAARPELHLPVPGFEQCIRAVVEYCIDAEQVEQLDDLIMRRLPLGDQAQPADETRDYCLGRLAEKRQWDESVCQQQRQQLASYFQPFGS